ncbi:hypothetical protein N7490_007095 [Penicillium lividum]|nr:hypothetical protein N7490_007095 [Penicillium lividum]
MATEKKEVAAAAATNIGCNNPGSCPVILAIGAANATSLRLLGSAGAPPAPKAPAVTGPRVCTEVVSSTIPLTRALAGSDDDIDMDEDLGQEENTAPVLDSVPSGAEEEIKMGSYTVSLKPSGNDWYEMDQEDREADSQKLSKA